MKFCVVLLIAIILLTIGGAEGQNNLQRLVDTENAFAQAAGDKGTRSAFLEFLSDDSVVFDPQRANGKQVWTARKESPAMLYWYPIFADISGNGLIGYTTGPWEYRPKGKNDAPAAFGHYMTIWQKQADGSFRAVLDLGVSHSKPTALEPRIATVPASTRKDPDIRSNAGDTASRFYELITARGAEKGYKEFAADDIRLMRDGKMPLIGKRAALKEIGSVKADLLINKRMSFYGTDDLSYATNTYSFKRDGTVIETGNFVQIWKNISGRWLIVMDIFVADPKK